jgi:hypothetical protein
MCALGNAPPTQVGGDTPSHGVALTTGMKSAASLTAYRRHNTRVPVSFRETMQSSNTHPYRPVSSADRVAYMNRRVAASSKFDETKETIPRLGKKDGGILIVSALSLLNEQGWVYKMQIPYKDKSQLSTQNDRELPSTTSSHARRLSRPNHNTISVLRTADRPC